MHLRQIRPTAAWAQFAVLVFVLSLFLLLLLMVLFHTPGAGVPNPAPEQGAATIVLPNAGSV